MFYLCSSAKLKTRFSWKENLKICTSFQEQEGTRYIRGNVNFDIVFRSLSSTKPYLKFIWICYTWERKGFYQISWGNEVDFTDMIYISQKISAQDWNFKKLRQWFVDERAMVTIISSCPGKTLIHFCLRKERPENVFLEPTLNCCKIIQKNNLRHPKQD